MENLNLPDCLPKSGTQCYRLLRAFQYGERLTVRSALAVYGIYALSQRVGELKRMGWPIQSRTLRVGSATHVCEYRLDA